MTFADESERRLLPGRKAVLEALSERPEHVESVYLLKGRKTSETDQILDLCRRANVAFRLVRKEELDRLFAGNHQGVVATLFERGFAELGELADAAGSAPLPVVVVLDRVQDPGNVGVLARTLFALGGAGLVVGKHGSARLGAGAERSSAGALSRLPVHKATNPLHAVEGLKEAGFFAYGAVMEGEKGARCVFDEAIAFPAALVLGSEEKGPSKSVLKACDGLLYVPMARPFDSLNVAQAGAILLGELARRQRM